MQTSACQLWVCDLRRDKLSHGAGGAALTVRTALRGLPSRISMIVDHGLPGHHGWTHSLARPDLLSIVPVSNRRASGVRSSHVPSVKRLVRLSPRTDACCAIQVINATSASA